MRPVNDLLKMLKNELNHELSSILAYWIKNTPDPVNGGFFGRINGDNQVVAGAAKGSVLNARILWSFSAAHNLTAKPEYLEYAGRAYRYINDHLIDKEYGGVYWSVNYKGEPLDTKKQVYAVAFTIYGLSEYYLASGDTDAKNLAIDLYKLLVEHSYDDANTGYLEAFTRDWKPLNDQRLSAKDANEKKTMNTHLHVLEAYATLYRIWPDEELKAQITTLIHNFADHFSDPETHHFVLFFDEKWNSRSGLVSYGHDIEATWLLQEAAMAINDQHLLERQKKANISIAGATLEGMDSDGGLWYEYEPADDKLIREKHWWVQAEAMVGYYNAWEITNDEKYLEQTIKSWNYIKSKLLDKRNGEWFWGINANGDIMPGEDKTGMWKCPYHNSRACMEIIKRIGNRNYE